MGIEVGSTVGDYQVIDILGSGGMGQVYKVRNVISDRIEAMKVLFPNLSTDPDLAARFVNEIKVQARLEHPNIAALHTAIHADNQLLLLMEYVEGVTLDQKLKDGPLPIGDAVGYGKQVLGALEYAHGQGIIHRDIKPSNIMLTAGGVVKLMDFGIAKTTALPKLTVTGFTVGSMYYMSPEQIQGVADLDARSDLYSLGVSLYELLTGKRPFDGDSQYAVIEAHLHKPPAAPIDIDPKLPQMLSDVILMSLAKDPNSRFQTAMAFRNALSNVLLPATASAPAAATPAPPPAPPRRDDFHLIEPTPEPAAPARGRRGLWMAVGAIAAAVAVVGIIEFGPHRATKAEPQRVTESAAPASAATPPPAPAPAAAEQQPSAPAPVPQPQAPATSPAASPKQAQTAKPAPAPKAVRVERPASEPQSPGVEAPRAAPVPQASPAPAVAPPPPASPPVPSGPTVAQMQEAREQWTLLNSRATGIRTSLDSLQRAQAASGLNLNSRFTQPAHMMDSYLEGANNALNAADLPAANDLMKKAERQIEILEKLLNR